MNPTATIDFRHRLDVGRTISVTGGRYVRDICNLLPAQINFCGIG